MTEIRSQEVPGILTAHQRYFATGVTKDVAFRRRQLVRLGEVIAAREGLVKQALYRDLHKSGYEAFTTEIGMLYGSIGQAVRKLKKWARPQRVGTPLVLFGTKSFIRPEPYGTALIVGPFNYPFGLVFEPLVGAIAAGNCAVIKPSALTPNVAGAIAGIIGEAFDEDYVSVAEGDREVASALINAPFDYIFFTGSVAVGRLVMEAAARNLVPVTLELGGKSPCIVDESASIDTAAQKIIWGKFTNAGQTCVAPDYVLVHRRVREPLVAALKKHLELFYGGNPRECADFCRLVSVRHAERLRELIDREKVVAGGDCDAAECYVAPTILDGVGWEDAVMEDEIFGPVLPVLEFENLDEVIRRLNGRPKPLALYLFTGSKDTERKIIEGVSYGGGCINETLVHTANPQLPFGGVGASGIGAYHGKRSFDTFSHMKGVLKRTINLGFNADIMYPPYNYGRLGLLRRLLR